MTDNNIDRLGIGMLYAGAAGIFIGSSPHWNQYMPYLGGGIMLSALLYEIQQKRKYGGNDA